MLSWLALGWCIVFCLIHFFRLIKLGKVKDLSQKSGNIAKAVIYSNTVSMLPNQKESAYKHLPTYTAGIIFHLGSFLSLLLFVLSLFDCFDKITSWLMFDGWWLLACMTCFLLLSFLCGFSLLLKRAFSKKLRPLSNFDDYFSNAIVTLFQFFSFSLLLIYTIVGKTFWLGLFDLYLCNVLFYGCYISAILLLLYLPFGKLKHAIYYFAARYHLGFFYGWRNTWPPHKKK